MIVIKTKGDIVVCCIFIIIMSFYHFWGHRILRVIRSSVVSLMLIFSLYKASCRGKWFWCCLLHSNKMFFSCLIANNELTVRQEESFDGNMYNKIKIVLIWYKCRHVADVNEGETNRQDLICRQHTYTNYINSSRRQMRKWWHDGWYGASKRSNATSQSAAWEQNKWKAKTLLC